MAIETHQAHRRVRGITNVQCDDDLVDVNDDCRLRCNRRCSGSSVVFLKCVPNMRAYDDVTVASHRLVT